MLVEGSIVLVRDVYLGTPEGGTYRGRAGDRVHVIVTSWPGKPQPEGTIGWIVGKGAPYTDWSFWTNLDIDGAFIFGADDVAELILDAPAHLPAAPFLITKEPT